MEEADRILMIRCLLNIWGTMLFLRLTWVIGQMGIWQVSQNITDQNQSGHKMTENNQGLMVITACNIITGLSALSMSAISTNGQIAAGGVYYMISRFLEKVLNKKKFTVNFNSGALGPAIGGSIGIMFTVSRFSLTLFYNFSTCSNYFTFFI